MWVRVRTHTPPDSCSGPGAGTPPIGDPCTACGSSHHRLGRQMGSPARATGQNTLRPILRPAPLPGSFAPEQLPQQNKSLLPTCSLDPTCHSMPSPKPFTYNHHLPGSKGLHSPCNCPTKIRVPTQRVTLPKKSQPSSPTLPSHLGI